MCGPATFICPVYCVVAEMEACACVTDSLQALRRDRSTREFWCGGRRPGFWLVPVTFFQMSAVKLLYTDISFILPSMLNDCRWRHASEKCNPSLPALQVMVRTSTSLHDTLASLLIAIGISYLYGCTLNWYSYYGVTCCGQIWTCCSGNWSELWGAPPDSASAQEEVCIGKLQPLQIPITDIRGFLSNCGS